MTGTTSRVGSTSRGVPEIFRRLRDPESTRTLLDSGADANEKDAVSGRAPLHSACELGASDVVRLLAERNADVSALDRGGRVPMHYAVRYRIRLSHDGICEYVPDPESVEMLLGAGADLNFPDYSGRTPLGFALFSADEDTVVRDCGPDVLRLLELGAEIGIPGDVFESMNALSVLAPLFVLDRGGVVRRAIERCMPEYERGTAESYLPRRYERETRSEFERRKISTEKALRPYRAHVALENNRKDDSASDEAVFEIGV